MEQEHDRNAVSRVPAVSVVLLLSHYLSTSSQYPVGFCTSPSHTASETAQDKVYQRVPIARVLCTVGLGVDVLDVSPYRSIRPRNRGICIR